MLLGEEGAMVQHPKEDVPGADRAQQDIALLVHHA